MLFRSEVNVLISEQEAKLTVLRGGLVVRMDQDRTLGIADLVMEHSRIVEITETADGAWPGADIVDCDGCLVIPGLIQPHTHLCQTLFRGSADGLELLDWLKERIWPFEASHTDESLYLGALLGGAELLRSGTTAILDMGTVHHTDAIFRACKVLGLRATIGKAMMDLGQDAPLGLMETADDSMTESIRLFERWHAEENDRLRYAFAPRFALSVSPDLMRETAKVARELGALLHTHASENPKETEVVRRTTGFDNVAYLDRLGLSGCDTVLAHCVWVSEDEMQMLAQSGTHVAHCPSSNLKLASGIAKVPEFFERGINVGLAADGAPCNNNLDIFREMRLAALIQNPRLGPSSMPAERVFEMATLGGARALGLEAEIGALAIGMKADVVVVDARSLHAAPWHDPYAMLVYALGGSDVRDVFIDGIVRVRGGAVLGVDTAKLLDEVERSQAHLV